MIKFSVGPETKVGVIVGGVLLARPKITGPNPSFVIRSSPSISSEHWPFLRLPSSYVLSPS